MNPPPLEPACAICGRRDIPECPHEGDRLQLALQQAQDRWAGVQRIRDWVLDHARNHIIHIFERSKAVRFAAHSQYLQTLPYYSLYIHHNGRPRLPPAELAYLQMQLDMADKNLRLGVDTDWRNACLMYPETLDYFFELVDYKLLNDGDERVMVPAPGPGRQQQKKIRRDSGVSEKGGRKKDRRG